MAATTPASPATAASSSNVFVARNRGWPPVLCALRGGEGSQLFWSDYMQLDTALIPHPGLCCHLHTAHGSAHSQCDVNHGPWVLRGRAAAQDRPRNRHRPLRSVLIAQSQTTGTAAVVASVCQLLACVCTRSPRQRTPLPAPPRAVITATEGPAGVLRKAAGWQADSQLRS